MLLSIAKDQIMPLLFRPSCELSIDLERGSLSPELLNFDKKWKEYVFLGSESQCLYTCERKSLYLDLTLVKLPTGIDRFSDFDKNFNFFKGISFRICVKKHEVTHYCLK